MTEDEFAQAVVALQALIREAGMDGQFDGSWNGCEGFAMAGMEAMSPESVVRLTELIRKGLRWEEFVPVLTRELAGIIADRQERKGRRG